MNFRILPSGDLLITASNQARSDIAANLRDGNRDSAEDFVIQVAREDYSYESTTGDQLCAMTDAPLIAEDMTVEDDGSRTYYGRVWKFDTYMLRDYLDDLARRGRCVFLLVADFGEAGEHVPEIGSAAYSEKSARDYENLLVEARG